MAKIYSQLERAQLENLGADPAAATEGRIWWRTDTDRVKVDTGASVLELVDLTSSQTLTGKTLTGNIAVNLVSGAATITLPTTTGTLATLGNTETFSGAKTFSSAAGLTLAEIATPATPASGFGALYFKSDGNVYKKDDGGTEVQLSALAFTQGAVVFGSGTGVTVDATNFFYDDGTNYLGLGTGSPGSRLDVVATNITAPAIGARYNSTNARMSINLGNLNGFPYLAVNATPTSSSDTANFDLSASTYAARLRMDNGIFQFDRSSAAGTSGNPITWSNSMYIDTSGRIGIGFSTVEEKLHVNGAISVTGTASAFSGLANTAGIIDVSAGLVRFTAGANSTNNRSMVLRANAAGTPNDNQLYLSFDNLVGIGTASPNTKLQVGASAGTGVITAFCHTTSSTSGTTSQGTGNASLPAVASGTTTGVTLNSISNLDATPTISQIQWLRVGNVVTCSGRVDIDPTAAGAFSFRMTPPIASGFTAQGDAGGSAYTADNNVFCSINAIIATDDLLFTGTAASGTGTQVYFHCTYIIK